MPTHQFNIMSKDVIMIPFKYALSLKKLLNSCSKNHRSAFRYKCPPSASLSRGGRSTGGAQPRRLAPAPEDKRAAVPLGADTLRERVAVLFEKAEPICAHRMSAAALGFRGLPLTRGSGEGRRVAALSRGFRGEEPRVTWKQEMRNGRYAVCQHIPSSPLTNT